MMILHSIPCTVFVFLNSVSQTTKTVYFKDLVDLLALSVSAKCGGDNAATASFQYSKQKS